MVPPSENNSTRVFEIVFEISSNFERGGRSKQFMLFAGYFSMEKWPTKTAERGMHWKFQQLNFYLHDIAMFFLNSDFSWLVNVLVLM